MILKLAIKNIFSRKSSFVIIFFIAFSISVLVLTNSIFDSTEHGIQETYTSSFTGDLVIRPKFETPISLLGDETPVTGTFTDNPILTPYEEICDLLNEFSEIKYFNPQISGFVALDFKGCKFPAIIFGTETEKYLKIMHAIKIEKGFPYESGKKGIMLSTQIANKIGAGIGSDIQFIVAEGLSARIRTAPITAVYSYPIENSIFDELVIISPDVARELLDINAMYSGNTIVLEQEMEDLLQTFDMENLFEDATDVDGITKDDFSFKEIESVKENDEDFSTTWNFIVCRLHDSNDTKKLIKLLNKKFKNNGWNVEAVNWRNAAGSNALYLYFLRLILNVGIFIVLIAGFIVINNTLVINILDRTREIGTMRAIGTSKAFVCFECMAETMIISIIAGIIGCVMGMIFSGIVSACHIPLTNSFLRQLFGGNFIITAMTFSNLIRSFIVSLVIGMIAWLYPVHTALKTNPVTAMQGVK